MWVGPQSSICLEELSAYDDVSVTQGLTVFEIVRATEDLFQRPMLIHVLCMTCESYIHEGKPIWPQTEKAVFIPGCHNR